MCILDACTQQKRNLMKSKFAHSWTYSSNKQMNYKTNIQTTMRKALIKHIPWKICELQYFFCFLLLFECWGYAEKNVFEIY